MNQSTILDALSKLVATWAKTFYIRPLCTKTTRRTEADWLCSESSRVDWARKRGLFDINDEIPQEAREFVCLFSVTSFTHQSSQYQTMKFQHSLDLRSSVVSIASEIAGRSLISLADPGFQREECFKKLTKILQGNDTSIQLDPTLFIDPNPANPILTVYGCEQLCGSGTGWYSDRGSRLVTWLLPVVLFIANLQFQPIGIQRFLSIIHLLGDPIDSTWSLLTKAHRWSLCFSTAQTLSKDDLVIKSLAVILAVSHEVSYHFDLGFLEYNARRNRRLVVDTARTLAGNRRNEFRRTLFALAFYIFQVLAAFVPAVGAAAGPSGGRIAMAMVLSWLIPISLLSNAVGDLGPLWNCQQTLNLLGRRLERPSNSKMTSSQCFERQDILTAWTGSIYSFQPTKRFLDTSGYRVFIISVLPVAFASAAAFAILDTGPSYFSCRHLLVISLFVVWVLSTVSTSWISCSTLGTAKSRWYLILIKDTIIASAVLTLIIASSCGLWKTCYCWSGALVHGTSKAQCQLMPNSIFDRNNKVIYPAMVTTSLCLQVLAFAAMVWVAWPGFRAMWWSAEQMKMLDLDDH